MSDEVSRNVERLDRLYMEVGALKAHQASMEKAIRDQYDEMMQVVQNEDTVFDRKVAELVQSILELKELVIDDMADLKSEVEGLDREITEYNRTNDNLAARLSKLEDWEVAVARRMKVLEDDTNSRMDRHHERITALEDCYTTPTNGSAEEGDLTHDPKAYLYERLLLGIKKYHTIEIEESKQKAWASRLAEALWKAGLKSPEKIAAATDKRLAGVKNLGKRYGLAVVRATFPRAL